MAIEKDMEVRGFKAWAVEAAIKKPGRLDIGLIYSEVPASVGGLFTRNRVKAAPVLLDMERIKRGTARAILANSGNANACTGAPGIKDALDIISCLSQELGVEEEEILVASTGVIGARLPVEKIKKAVPSLVRGLSYQGLEMFAKAIMTTDTFPKISQVKASSGGVEYTILGIAKGAGMIMPDMATMLCFILTDLNLGPRELQEALWFATEKSFNRITIDGDTSTNDTILCLANGLAGNRRPDQAGILIFRERLSQVCQDLARLIVKDGEGATKLINIVVRSAKDPQDAMVAARTVANSPLVKTAFFGQDPNWGRIMAALGRSGADFDPGQVDIFIGQAKVVENGVGTGYKVEEAAKEEMRKGEFEVIIELKKGEAEFSVITCDLSYDYVRINAEYRT